MCHHIFMRNTLSIVRFFNETGELIDGVMPRRAIRLVQDWAE